MRHSKKRLPTGRIVDETQNGCGDMDEEIIEKLEMIIKNLSLIDADEIPNIDLYMDQVITFMERHLGKLRRNPEDKVLTKTMINNYAKTHLIPSPEKKKYTKNHVLLLSLIYYLKKVLSINDISTMLQEITEKHFENPRTENLEDLYKEVAGMAPDVSDLVKGDVRQEALWADQAFSDVKDEKEQEELKRFAFLCLLGFDIFLKRTLMERLIDEMMPETEEKKTKNKDTMY